MNGLDLFSGIGGIAEALSPWVETVAYCENERYAQAVLLSRMSRGEIHTAPIWDDVTTLAGKALPPVDIISGGFPCQDISSAGRGAGLEGKRSGLFQEIVRLSGEIRPTFIFLENVPAIAFRGLDAVTATLSELRYDCRWGMLSAFDMGAPHRRERWWCLARNTESDRGGKVGEIQEGKNANARRICEAVVNTNGDGYRRESRRVCEAERGQNGQMRGKLGGTSSESSNIPNTNKAGMEGGEKPRGARKGGENGKQHPRGQNSGRHPWTTEPSVGRVVNGLPFRSDRLKCLGNSVVPQCAREAFERLMGLK